MRLKEVVQFVNGTSDPAFAVDGFGNIRAWNQAAAELFGNSSAEIIGSHCSEVICGNDEDGMICSSECIVLQSAKKRRQMSNFDFQIDSQQGKKWFNVSLTMVDVINASQPYTIHILRLVDVPKRLELLVRDFVHNQTENPDEKAVTLISFNRSAVREMYLTNRELEILRLVAKGKTSVNIADDLKISPTTVNNHLQHILKKLNAHSRLEAIRRAEHSGLL